MDFFGIKLYMEQSFKKFTAWINRPLSIVYTNLDRIIDVIQVLVIIGLSLVVYFK